MNEAYPLNHYLNSGNREVTFIYCADAVKAALASHTPCRDCLLWDGEKCGANPNDDDRKICPFLEVDPAYYGMKTRLKQRRRR